ncbi:MAG: TlpA family protein disulfide reductase [Candidatus Binataceae bacterium]
MSRDGKILSALAGLAMLAALGLIVLNALAAHGPRASASSTFGAGASPVAAGKLAPDFTLADLDGKSHSLAALRGKIVFLNLWATWCPPCRREMPSIQALYRDFQSNDDFVVLAVSEDTDVKPVPGYVKQNHLGFPVLLDPRNLVGEAYEVSGLPESFVIGRDGRIVAHHVGPYDWASADLREALQDLIKAKG